MIRRAFWLSVGAAAGITGYRRASAVKRLVSARMTGSLAGVRAREVPGPFWPPQPGQAAQPSPARQANEPSQADEPGQAYKPGQAYVPGQGYGPGQGAPARLAPARPAGTVVPRAYEPAQWSTVRMAWRTSRAAWRTQKAAAARVRAASRFARDVREGMDMYMNRQEE